MRLKGSGMWMYDRKTDNLNVTTLSKTASDAQGHSLIL